MSNNFVTPRAVATLSQSRIDYNNSLLALLQNFSSSGQPSASSVNLEGVTGLKQGMLWYKAGSNTADGQGRLTVYDGANFVRTGIAVYRMPSGAVANVAIGNNKITSGELIDIGDNRLYMVNASNTGYVDVGLPPTGYTVDNAQTLDNLDSTQFLRSDVADTIEGPLTGEPMLRLTNTTTNSLSVASLWLSGDRGTLLFDSTGNKRITWNDTTNQFSIRAGAYTDGSIRYTTTGDGIADLNFFHESTHGGFILRIADIGTAGATPVWAQTLVLNNTGLALNSNTIWHAGNDGAGSGLDADTLDGTQLVTIQGAYAANDGVTLATARGNDHATLLSARANDLSTYNTLVNEYRANDWNTLSTARANDLATLTSAQANDWNTLATARANDLSTYNTLVSEYRANDWNTFSTLSANDGVTLSTAIANDFATFSTLSANDWNTLSTARANDGTTLATARGNDHSTLLSARANDFATFTTLSANDWNTFTTLSANDGVVRSLAIANDYNGYLTFRGEFLGNDHSTLLSASANDGTTLATARGNDHATLLSARANDFATWSGINNYVNLKANTASPTFTGGVTISNTISGGTADGVLTIYGGSGFSGANIELYGPDHTSQSNRIYYDAFAHTFRANSTNAVRLNIDGAGNVGVGTTTTSANLHVIGDIRATTRFLGNSADTPANPTYTWDQDDNSGFYRRSADIIGVSTGGKSAAEFTNTGNFRIFNSTGTFYTEIQSEPTGNTALVIPAGGAITLAVGTMATTDTNQNITGNKTFLSDIILDGLNRTVRKSNTGGALVLTSGNSSSDGGSFVLYGNASALPNNVVVNADRLLVRPVNTVGVTLAVVGTSNVGVGTAATSANLHVIGDIRATTRFLGNLADSNAVPSYSWDSDNNTGMFRADADTIGFSTNGLERARITSLGNVAIGRTTAACQVDIEGAIRASDGIAFGTDNPGQAANRLDDYEEGTWVVEVYDSATGLPSTSNTTGVYTKIGNLIFASFSNLNNINLAGFNTSNTFSVSLPFTALNNGGAGGTVAVNQVVFPFGATYATADVGVNTNRAQIRIGANNIVSGILSVSNFTSNVSDIVRFSVVYRGA